MNYLELVKIFFDTPHHCSLNNFFETMYCLVSMLKKQGIEKEMITQEIVDVIADGILNPKVTKVFRVRFNNYIIYYLGFLMDLDYDYECTEKFDKIMTDYQKIEEEPKEIEGSINTLNPEDFKKKEYDMDFLKMIGAGKDDNNV